MAYLLAKRRSALPTPEKNRRITMATFLLSSVESSEGGHGLCHHLLDGHLLPFLSRELWKVMMAYLLEKGRSALLVLRRTRC